MYIDTNVQLAIAAARQLSEKGGLRVHILVPDQTEFNRSYKMCGPSASLSSLVMLSREFGLKTASHQLLHPSGVHQYGPRLAMSRLCRGLIMKKLRFRCPFSTCRRNTLQYGGKSTTM